MFKRMMFAAALMVVATPAMAQDMDAAGYAEMLQGHLNQDMAGGIKITAARAEGNLLILTIDAPSWNGVNRADISGVFAGGFCEEGDGNFFKSNRMRVDTTEAGKGLATGTIVEKCPATEAAAQ